MAQGATNFSAPPVLRANSPSLRPNPNLFRNFSQFDKLGMCYDTHNQAGFGESRPVDFLEPSKRGREEQEEDMVACTSATYSDVLPAGDHHQLSHKPPCYGSLHYLPEEPNSDISMWIQQDLSELELFISLQMDRLRAEMEQKRRRQWGGVVRAVEDRVQRVLLELDEKIASMARRNTALEEHADVLAREGQAWKALTRTNEAAAAALRRDIELARQRADAVGEGATWDVDAGCGEVQDSASCCEGRREEEEVCRGGGRSRQCRVCRAGEASTLVLPCRHLSLCDGCDPATATCPLCGCPKSNSIQVLLS